MAYIYLKHAGKEDNALECYLSSNLIFLFQLYVWIWEKFFQSKLYLKFIEVHDAEEDKGGNLGLWMGWNRARMIHTFQDFYLYLNFTVIQGLNLQIWQNFSSQNHELTTEVKIFWEMFDYWKWNF